MSERPAPKQFRKRPVVIEAMQFPVGYPKGVDPSSDGYAANRQAHAVFSWVEANTAGGFEPMDVIEGRKPFPATGVSIDPRDGRMIISTLEGLHWVDLGDWVIRGVAGEFYPCKPQIFADSYAEVGSDFGALGYGVVVSPADVAWTTDGRAPWFSGARRHGFADLFRTEAEAREAAEIYHEGIQSTGARAVACVLQPLPEKDWYVHVIGPDDGAGPFPGRAAAEADAAATNEAVRAHRAESPEGWTFPAPVALVTDNPGGVPLDEQDAALAEFRANQGGA